MLQNNPCVITTSKYFKMIIEPPQKKKRGEGDSEQGKEGDKETETGTKTDQDQILSTPTPTPAPTPRSTEVVDWIPPPAHNGPVKMVLHLRALIPDPCQPSQCHFNC
jgi:hypothetical protein